MLRNPKCKVLRQNNLSTADVEFVEEGENSALQESSPMDATIKEKDVLMPQINSTRTPCSTRHLPSRRRPTIKQSEAEALAGARLKTLHCTNEQAAQQHEVTMRILDLQEQQEKIKLKQECEKLRQEEVKTQILLEELNKARQSFSDT